MEKKRIVFLGTPSIVVPVLEKLLNVQAAFEIVGVVSQPPTRAVRGNSTVPSPVHARALEAGVPVLTPDDAKASTFIEQIAALKPDLCVTAAYGQVLSEEFLAIAPFGTLNIHPSLLPLFRGAAPVQRTLQEGAQVTGVTIAKTVRAMDAGPIVSQIHWKLDDTIRAPELLQKLFEAGAEELVRILPDYFAGLCQLREQDHEKATKAKKIQMEEGNLKPDLMSAREMHNRTRAFFGWPGTRLMLVNASENIEVKVISTSVLPQIKAERRDLFLSEGGLELVCSDGSVLQILELQAPGKRAMTARDFWNGLKVKSLRWA
jgi:methionyl-tRNA formyltransferase